jgi:ketosteroid isomerase-like protein
MSQENVELQHRIIDAFNRRDLRTFLALTDPDVEFTPYEVFLEGGEPYRGHAGVRRWWEDAFAVLPNLSAEVYEIRDLGSRNLVHGCLRAHGAGSGAPIERTMWLGVEWRDEKTVWWCGFDSEVQALEAMSLSE